MERNGKTEEKNTENGKKLGDAERNKKKWEDTGRNCKKQEKKKQKVQWSPKKYQVVLKSTKNQKSTPPKRIQKGTKRTKKGAKFVAEKKWKSSGKAEEK